MHLVHAPLLNALALMEPHCPSREGGWHWVWAPSAQRATCAMKCLNQALSNPTPSAFDDSSPRKFVIAVPLGTVASYLRQPQASKAS